MTENIINTQNIHLYTKITHMKKTFNYENYRCYSYKRSQYPLYNPYYDYTYMTHTARNKIKYNKKSTTLIIDSTATISSPKQKLHRKSPINYFEEVNYLIH